MAIGQTSGDHAPAAVESLVKQLLVTRKAVKLYPAASNIPRENAVEVIRMLRGMLQVAPTVRLAVTKEGLFYETMPVLPGRPAFVAFAREFYSFHLSDIRFHSGVTPEEVVAFLAVLNEPPEEVDAAGGFGTRLWDRQVDGVTVGEIATKIVDISEPTAEETAVAGAPEVNEQWPPEKERIDELLNAMRGLRPHDQRMLARFVQSPRLTADYLEEATLGRPIRAAVTQIADRIASLARVASAEPAEDQPTMYRSIAESMMSLDSEVRHRLLVDRLLADARVDEGLAEVIRQIDLADVCTALAEGLTPDHVSQEGISRALRNLALITLSAREDVADAARTALLDAGAAEDEASSILEAAMPTRLQITRRAQERPETPLDGVLKLVDLASSARQESDADADVAALRAEARAGVTDADVLAALVTLVTLERRPDVFGSMMALVEDSLGMLLEWSEFEIAADAAAELTSLETDSALEPPARERVREAVSALARPDQMRLIATAMRVYRTGSPEQEACRRLLVILGAHAIAPLLEVLADEPDMSARKALVELISKTAQQHVSQLGEAVNDSRWYFVRNVVSILGATRRPEALPYLARTIHHGDSRVRREAIRACAGIRDRYAEEMLVAALADEDAQNVQLAARYLGTLGARGAVAALSMVAKGDGRGNRDVGSRVEAIEALGHIGSPDAIPVLAQLAEQRTILRAGRSREIKAAAEAALNVVNPSWRGEAGS
ncbi:MAG: HEAT repeat domain-containing protein [Coriobacteriia bacterium]